MGCVVRLEIDPLDHARFWGKVEVGTLNDCWRWTGWIDQYGYGGTSHQGRNVGAHRFAYRICVGEVPDGLVLDHLCRNTWCVNPTHLEPVTVRENNARAQLAKTHCPHGHPYSGDNLIVDKKRGWRICRECRRRYNKVKRIKAFQAQC